MPSRRYIGISLLAAAAVGVLVSGGPRALAVLAFFAIVVGGVFYAVVLGGDWLRDVSARRFDRHGRR